MDEAKILKQTNANDSRLESPKIKKLSYTPLIVALLVILALLIIPIASLVSASYLSSDIPFVPKNLQRKVDSTIASIPLIPKTPKQIITRVFDNKKRIETSKEAFVLSMKNNGQDLATLKINSQLDTKDLKKPFLSADILAEIPTGRQTIRYNLSLTEINKDCYFKINEIPNIPGYSFSKIKGRWFGINLDTASYDIGASVRSDNDIYNDMSGKMSELALIFDNDLAKKIKKLPDEKISGDDSFHLQLSPDSQTLTKIFGTIYPDAKLSQTEIKNTFKELKIDLWVNKSNFYIYKIEITTALGDLTNSLSDLSTGSKLQVNFSYQLSEVNRTLKITAPQSPIKLKSFMDLDNLIESGASSPGPVLGVSTNLDSFGSDTLYYERLLHVVTLLPSVVK